VCESHRPPLTPSSPTTLIKTVLGLRQALREAEAKKAAAAAEDGSSGGAPAAAKASESALGSGKIE